MAFLLRATAHEASESSDSSGSFSSDESEPRRPAKRGRPRRAGKASPRRSTAQGTPDAPVIYCGRGRPPKNSIKLPPGAVNPYRRAARASPRSHALRVKTHDEDKQPSSIKENKDDKMALKQEKASPSSTSDVALLGGAATPFCALCCDLEPFCDAPLFLCPACDQKYPTQKALGRACMT